MSKDYPKPVESGELLTINNLITKWAQIVGVKDGFSYVVKILIDPADGFADDAFSSNLRYELEAYLAQEKAKWVAEVLDRLESTAVYAEYDKAEDDVICGDVVPLDAIQAERAKLKEVK